MKLSIDLVLPPGKYIYVLLEVGDNLPRLDNAVVFEAAAAQSLLFISVEFFKCWTKIIMTCYANKKFCLMRSVSNGIIL